MDRKKFIIKIACLIGFLLFAGFSAYFTASSLSLNLLNGTNLWLVYALVLVVAILTSWFLANAIKELRNRVNASRMYLTLNLIGFIIFWTFSFMTNVHYFFVEKHGHSILTKELVSAKNYIIEQTSQSDQLIENKKNAALDALNGDISTYLNDFEREIHNTIAGHYGFGGNCLTYLKSIENRLNMDSEQYGDQHKYVIYSEAEDKGDLGVTDRNSVEVLYEKYSQRVQRDKLTKVEVISNYYDRQKGQKKELIELLEPINKMEQNDLRRLEEDGTVGDFYKQYKKQDSQVISKMPTEYTEANIVKNGADIESFKVYPSQRMFDTVSVWSDITGGRLLGLSMLQWIIIALIFDIVSFILFTVFKNS